MKTYQSVTFLVACWLLCLQIMLSIPRITSSLYGTKFFKNDIQILYGHSLRATDDGLIFVVVDRRSTHCFKLVFNLLFCSKTNLLLKWVEKVLLNLTILLQNTYIWKISSLMPIVISWCHSITKILIA